MLPPNSKPIIVEIIYRPPCQTNFIDLLNGNVKQIYSADNEIYIFSDFNINLFLNDTCILEKKIPWIANQFKGC